MAEALEKDDAEKLRKNEVKWTKPVMVAGWNAFPSIIIEKQEALGLDALDMNIVLHLSNYWWTRDNLPHPSVASIAKAIGVKPRTVQKRIKTLCELGLMTRQERRQTKAGSTTNLYGFKGLIEKVTPFAEEKLQQIEKWKKDEAERLARKKAKPSLHVVASND